jgi:hypothetical protein
LFRSLPVKSLTLTRFSMCFVVLSAISVLSSSFSVFGRLSVCLIFPLLLISLEVAT